VLLQNSHSDFSSKQNTLFLYQKFKIVISDDQDCVISDDRSQLHAHSLAVTVMTIITPRTARLMG
jgi:hypothetical protein